MVITGGGSNPDGAGARAALAHPSLGRCQEALARARRERDLCPEPQRRRLRAFASQNGSHPGRFRPGRASGQAALAGPRIQLRAKGPAERQSLARRSAAHQVVQECCRE